MADSVNKVLFKFGTRAQYDALDVKLANALYFLTDTGELYRGDTAFGQAHVYSVTRLTNESDQTAIARILDSTLPAINDLVIIRNADNTNDIFMYVDGGWIRLNSHAVNQQVDALDDRVEDVEDTVSDLDAIINGVEADPQNNVEAVPGLVDRVDDLETALAQLSGALHFKGSVADYAALQAIVSPTEGDVYQVGNDEYAWNGSAWVQLGGQFDLTNYVTTSDLTTELANYATSAQLASEVATLEALIGAPASTTTDEQTGETTTTPASGIYADLATNAADIIPLFDGTVAGLVPVATGNLSAQDKAALFMNALGNWVNVPTGQGGQSTYTDPNGVTYNTVEAYVEAMLDAATLEWSSI